MSKWTTCQSVTFDWSDRDGNGVRAHGKNKRIAVMSSSYADHFGKGR